MNRLKLSLSTNQVLLVFPINRQALTSGLGPFLDLLPFFIGPPKIFSRDSGVQLRVGELRALSTNFLHHCLWRASLEQHHFPHIISLLILEETDNDARNPIYKPRKPSNYDLLEPHVNH